MKKVIKPLVVTMNNKDLSISFYYSNKLVLEMLLLAGNRPVFIAQEINTKKEKKLEYDNIDDFNISKYFNYITRHDLESPIKLFTHHLLEDRIKEFNRLEDIMVDTINGSIKQIDLETTEFPVVTLIGSSKYKKSFDKLEKLLTLSGHIVINIGLFEHSGDAKYMTEKVKNMHLEMQLRKIDMADIVYVVNEDNYIGESTEEQIKYAKSKNKIIKYLSTDNPSYIRLGEISDSLREL